MHTRIIAFVTAATYVAISTTAFGQDAQPDAKKVEAGEAVYNDYCETCHGHNMVNTGQSSFDLRKLRPDERPRFEHSVMNGKGNMPPWKGVLDADQIDVLWAFIQAKNARK